MHGVSPFSRGRVPDRLSCGPSASGNRRISTDPEGGPSAIPTTAYLLSHLDPELHIVNFVHVGAHLL